MCVGCQVAGQASLTPSHTAAHNNISQKYFLTVFLINFYGFLEKRNIFSMMNLSRSIEIFYHSALKA